MTDVHVRLYYRNSKGETVDGGYDLDIAEDFGGIVPVVGDRFFDNLVLDGRDRNDPRSRRVLTVIERVFHVRDTNLIALVVKEAPISKAEKWMMP